MTEYTVRSANELYDRLEAASGGDTLLLENGNYGSIDFDDLHFSDYVTIRSADGPLGARFTDISFDNSSYLRVDGVHVDGTHNGSLASHLVGVDGGSHHIEFLNSEVNGLVDDDYTGWRGIYSGVASDVRFENNYIHDVMRGGVFINTENLEVSENRFENLGDDAMKISGVSDALIENNTGARYIHAGPGAHIDFIQFQGADSEDVTVRGNVYLQGTNASQGIFMSGATVDNMLIENNIIYNSMINAISVTAGSTNVVVRDNTVLTVPGEGHKAAILRLPAGAVSENNITSSHLSASGPSGSNVVLQYENPDRPYYYNDVYENAMTGRFATIEDLTPVPGSVGETMGAFQRIEELLGNVDHDDPATDSHTTGEADASAGDDNPAGGSTDDSGSSTGDGESGSDTGTDSGSDTGTDSGSDPAADGGSDAAADGGSDAAADGGSDAAADGGSDAAADGGSDTATDGGSDTATDGGSDTATDGGSDAAADGGSDTATDGGSDAAADGGSDTATDGDAVPNAVLTEGPYSLSGSVRDAVVLPGSSVHNLEQGTIEIEFNTDTVGRARQGLFSKDSRYYDDGGHLSIFVENDDVYVRMQDTDNDYAIRARDVVQAGSDHDLVFAFGESGMKLYMDGNLVAENAYTGGLQGNNEPIVIGANQWASGDGVADLVQHPFDGTITNMTVYDLALDPATLAGDYGTL